MTAQAFFRNYGQHIRRMQSDPNFRSFQFWPYIDPSGYQNCIDIPNSIVKKVFKYLGIVYQEYLSGVIYGERLISYMKLPSRYCAAISFQFTGCYMAKVCFRKEWYVFHIATFPDRTGDRKYEWMDFLNLCRNDISAICMFRPSDQRELFDEYLDLWKRGEDVTLACLIDDRNIAHTIVYDKANCSVYNNDDQNIRVCHASLLCRDIDRAHYWNRYL